MPHATAKTVLLRGPVRDLMPPSADGATREPPKEFLVWPFGTIDTTKGEFLLTEENCDEVLAERAEHSADVQIDYDHLAIEAAKPGDGKAAGWCKLQKRADGLWAVDVRWTPAAEQMLRDAEYRYFSPAFMSDPETGEVRELINIAITNLPATKNIRALVPASRALTNLKETKTMAHKLGGFIQKHMKDNGISAASMAEKCGVNEDRFRELADGDEPSQEEMSAVGKAMGMKDGELSEKLSAFDGQNPDKVDDGDEDDDAEEEKKPVKSSRRRDASGLDLVALTGETDPRKQMGKLKAVFAKAESFDADHAALVKLQKERESEKRAALIATAKKDGKLNPKLLKYCDTLKSVEELEAYLDAAPAMFGRGAETLEQIDPKSPDAILTREEREVAKLLDRDVVKLAAFVKDHRDGKTEDAIRASYRAEPTAVVRSVRNR